MLKEKNSEKNIWFYICIQDNFTDTYIDYCQQSSHKFKVLSKAKNYLEFHQCNRADGAHLFKDYHMEKKVGKQLRIISRMYI